MALIAQDRFKIALGPESNKVQGLRVGDVALRKYYNNTTQFYSLLVVESIGNSVDDGDYFIGRLIDGMEPGATGVELLDFVRVTNLFDEDRMGALYMTASDSNAPFMDTVDALGKEAATYYPSSYNSGNGYYVNGSPTYGSYEQSGRSIKITRNDVASSSEGLRSYFPMNFGQLELGKSYIVSYKCRASKSFASTTRISDESSQDVNTTYITNFTTEWQYIVQSFSVDNDPSSNYFQDFLGTSLSSGEWVEYTDFSVIELNSIISRTTDIKSRVGRLDGVADPSFGELKGYGVYTQKLYATKDVNVTGTITAGDKDGFGSTFYAGRIAKNLVINSINPDIVDKTVDDLLVGPTGSTGGVMRLGGGTNNRFFFNSVDWYANNVGKEVTVSMWVKSLRPDDLYVSLDTNGSQLPGEIDITNDWVRITKTFKLPSNYAGSHCFIDIYSPTSKNDEILIWGPQLEYGDTATQYQPTDDVLSEETGYGMWASRGGFGGTMQNPILKLKEDGTIVGGDDKLILRPDGSAEFKGAIVITGSGGEDLDVEVAIAEAKSEAISDATDQAANDTADQISALEIGGNNIFNNSDFYGGITGWSVSNSASYTISQTTPFPNPPAEAIAFVKPTVSTSQSNAFFFQTLELELSTIYTASFWIYVPSGQPNSTLSIWYVDGSWKTITNIAVTQKDTWVKVSKTFTTNSVEHTHVVGCGPTSGAAGNYVYVCLAKLEKGEKATSWSQSVQDTRNDAISKADIAESNAINTAATDAQNKADSAQAAAEANAATDAQGRADVAESNAINTAATDAQNKADTAETNAISAAAIDATNKANTAKAEAIEDANIQNDALRAAAQKFSGIYEGDWRIGATSSGHDFTFSPVPDIYKDYIKLSIYQLDLEANVEVIVNGEVLISSINGADGVPEWRNFSIPSNLINTSEDNIVRIQHNGGVADWGNVYKVIFEFDSKSYAEAQGTAAQSFTNDSINELKNNYLGDLALLDTLDGGKITSGTIEYAKLGSTLISGGYLKTELLDATAIQATIINVGYIEGLSLNFTKGYVGGWVISDGLLSANGLKLDSNVGSISGSGWDLLGDGSGSLANGNISWGADGAVHINPTQVSYKEFKNEALPIYSFMSAWHKLNSSSTSGWQWGKIATIAITGQYVTCSFSGKIRYGSSNRYESDTYDLFFSLTVPAYDYTNAVIKGKQGGVGSIDNRLRIIRSTQSSVNSLVYEVHILVPSSYRGTYLEGVWSPGNTDVTLDSTPAITSTTPNGDDVSEWEVTEDILALRNSISSDNWEDVPTIIEGGKIATGLVAANSIVAGTITADKIAASAITADKIQTTTITSLGAVTAGSFNLGSGKFSVTADGTLSATGATISGTITAADGFIGGWNIHNAGMQHLSNPNGEGYYSVAIGSTVGAFGSRGGLGFSFYRDDGTIEAGEVKYMQFGQVSNLDSQSDYSHGNYGINIGIKGGKSILRIADSYARIAGWQLNEDKLWAGNEWGSGSGGIELSATNKRLLLHSDSSNYLNVWYNSAADWGLNAKIGGQDVFKIGTTNFISGWTIAASGISKTYGTVHMDLGAATQWSSEWNGLHVGRDANNRLWVGSNGSVEEMSVFQNGEYVFQAGGRGNSISSWNFNLTSMYKATTSGEVALGSPVSWSSSFYGIHAGRDSANRIWLGTSGSTEEIAVIQDSAYVFRAGGNGNSFAGFVFDNERMIKVLGNQKVVVGRSNIEDYDGFVINDGTNDNTVKMIATSSLGLIQGRKDGETIFDLRTVGVSSLGGWKFNDAGGLYSDYIKLDSNNNSIILYSETETSQDAAESSVLFKVGSNTKGSLGYYKSQVSKNEHLTLSDNRGLSIDLQSNLSRIVMGGNTIVSGTLQATGSATFGGLTNSGTANLNGITNINSTAYLNSTTYIETANIKSFRLTTGAGSSPSQNTCASYDVIVTSVSITLPSMSSTYNGKVLRIINTSTSNRSVSSSNMANSASYTLYDRESRSFIAYNGKWYPHSV